MQEKYGFVDKDYDENPTRRGKEWLDIHHILEYDLDDIARRTENAKATERHLLKKEKGEIIIILHPEDFCDEKITKIKKIFGDKKLEGILVTGEFRNKKLLYCNEQTE